MLSFAKYHGLGNDFVVIDLLRAGRSPTAAEVRGICDRHRGVGADGVLSLLPDSNAACRMRTQNSDGSDAEVCGNGLRCAARFLYDKGYVPESQREVVLAAGERLYRAVHVAKDRFRVGMGRAIAPHPDLPEGARAPQAVVELVAADRRFAASCVALGNPHAVIFTDTNAGAAGDSPRSLAAAYGPILTHHPEFANGVNVSFARGVADGFEAVVYERGAGITEACGSGACAIVAAAVARGLWGAGEAARVHLQGGLLDVRVGDSGEIEMTGPAVRVFQGELEEELGGWIEGPE